MPFDSAPVDTDPVVLALVAAKAMIADPKNWCQGIGRVGHKRCAMVALQEASPTLGEMMAPLRLVLSAGVELFNQANIPQLNDTLGHAAVMQVYDRAIEMARARALQGVG